MSDTPLKTETDPDSGEDEVIVGATGQELKEQREALGASLSDISDTLCIRRDFIEALESGSYDVLPGQAYAVGFVRSYAKHLGLNADRIARQFKAEVTGDHPTAKLDFLTPVAESRVPTGAVVFVAVLLALAVYGLWYFMNAQDLTVSDVVPEIPADLVGTEVQPATGPAATPAEEPGPAAGSASPSPSPAVGGAAPESAPEAATGATMETTPGIPEAVSPEAGNRAAGEAAISEGQEAAVAASPAVDAGRPPGAETAVPSVPPAAQPAAPEATTLPAAGAPEVQQSEAARPEQVAETGAAGSAAAEGGSASADLAASAPESEAPASDQVASAAGAARIVLRATSDSWVEIRTEEGSLVLSRILRQGTNYEVPDRPGLSLTIGNAGGLEIVVDGAPIPSLGPFGAVRRDIVLDPARLKAGTAYSR
ncbi:MAG TPA: RodZ domain-containing protein [Alphaproteobacteria bacterium]|nr:RodZ domain-containing protein [Alphaproteobacteria bacterium]